MKKGGRGNPKSRRALTTSLTPTRTSGTAHQSSMACLKKREGRWEDISPELLGLICSRIPADVVLRTVPFVCRSWRDALAGPSCWSEIDLQDWCRRVNRRDLVDAAVRRLLRRSAASLRRLSAYRIGVSPFRAAAQYSSSLTVLQIPMSEVTDSVVEDCLKSLKMLSNLDISYCLEITYKGIETLGNNCQFLVHLRRNMPPPDIDWSNQQTDVSNANEEEALAIACNMSKLKHLELCYGRFSDLGLQAILDTCKDLIVLDIRGCWNVNFEGFLESRCKKIPKFKEPCHDVYEDAWLYGD